LNEAAREGYPAAEYPVSRWPGGGLTIRFFRLTSLLVVCLSLGFGCADSAPYDAGLSSDRETGDGLSEPDVDDLGRDDGGDPTDLNGDGADVGDDLDQIGELADVACTEPETFFPDPDGDGYYGRAIASVQPSCAAWLAAGEIEDGVYDVDPDGDGGDDAIAVYCDMVGDGGGWTRVFFHDVADGYWADDDDALEHNVENPLAPRYSILSRLEALRSSDGSFEMRIDWPNSGIPSRNIWRQTSNPTSESIAGYEAFDVDYTVNGWGGLEYNSFNSASFIDGSVGLTQWFYAVGSTLGWSEPAGIPAHNLPAARVAVWVRPDDTLVTVEGIPISSCGRPEGYAQLPSDCAPDEPSAFPGGDEVCDGIDNDCDGDVDEGFTDSEWYPDADGDGVGAGSGSSCASLLADGATDDGIYEVMTDAHDGPTLRVWCDMTTDGGGWTRVFYHDVAAGYFASNDDADARSPNNPLSGRYSILNYLESLRSTDDTLEMRINWPGTGLPGRNIWSQESNPTAGPVTGYAALDIDYAHQRWGGLELSDAAATYLDGSVGHGSWFYSIGSQVPWNSGIPSYGPAASRVALWVRPDDNRAGGTPVVDCVQPLGYVDNDGDCDDTNGEALPGVDELCNGFDDDCDGLVDTDCPFGDVELSAVPSRLHFFPRDLETDECTFSVAGETVGVASEVRVSVTQDDLPFFETIRDTSTFAVEVTIESGLHLYDVTVEWGDRNGWWRHVETVEDTVCGDVFLIDGQSNAVAIDYHNEGNADAGMNTFVRSYGSSVNNSTVVTDEAFGKAVAAAGYSHGAVGQWGLQLANGIVEAQEIPVLIINGAVGGTRVDQHQRNGANPDDVDTIYGRLLWRVQHAEVAEAVRAVFWHQGESDSAMAFSTYLDLWTAMYNGWLLDYPNIEAVYPFQVRTGCGGPTWNRNVQRELPELLPMVIGNMSTTGVDGHDGCHFFSVAYEEWGRRMARLVNRDLYGSVFDVDIDAPNPVEATWLSATQLEIDFGTTGGSLTLQAGAEAYFSLSDEATITDISVVGNTVVLTSATASTATWVSFVDTAGDIPWLVNELGIGSFAWYQFPITP